MRNSRLVRMEDCDREALAVAWRLVRFAKREGITSVFGTLNPDAVAINLDRMREDFDSAEEI